MRTLVAENGVAAMPWVDPRLVVVALEDLGDDTVVQRVEIWRGPRSADSAGKQAITREQVGVSGGIVVTEYERSGCVAHKMDGGQRAVPEPNHVALVYGELNRNFDARSVLKVGVDWRPGPSVDLREGTPVIEMPVGGDDPHQAISTYQIDNSIWFRGGINEDLSPSG